MIYMLNEASLEPVNSVAEAKVVLSDFIQAVISVEKLGFTELRIFEQSLQNLYSLALHIEYRIDNWLADPSVSELLKERFRTIVTTYPLITADEISEIDLYERSHYTLMMGNKIIEVRGLGAASIFETLSLSLSSNNFWRRTQIEIDHYYLETNGEEATRKVLVKNFATADHLDVHLPWWEKLQLESLRKSSELWTQRKILFPHLEFCPDVQDQIMKVGVSKALTQIFDRLRVLDKYVASWKSGSFNYEDANEMTNLRISPESKTTLQKFGALRKFFIPQKKVKKIFDLHIKTGNLRFHFYPDNEERKVYIGYIGKHLRIASED